MTNDDPGHLFHPRGASKRYVTMFITGVANKRLGCLLRRSAPLKLQIRALADPSRPLEANVIIIWNVRHSNARTICIDQLRIPILRGGCGCREFRSGNRQPVTLTHLYVIELLSSVVLWQQRKLRWSGLMVQCFGCHSVARTSTPRVSFRFGVLYQCKVGNLAPVLTLLG